MSHSSLVRLWLSSLTPSRQSAVGAAQARRPAQRRHGRLLLLVEPLEERTVLSVPLVVTSLADSGAGTLRAAWNDVSLLPHDSFLIDFAVTGSIELDSPLGPVLNNQLITIQGPGAGNLTVQRDGFLKFPIFDLTGPTHFNISGLTIANGDADAGNGGGIDNTGTLTVTNSIFANNSGTDGGGIENQATGTATITGCTFTNNSAAGNGGGIDNAGTVTIADCTLTDNSADAGNGGGIFSGSNATLTVDHTTFASNTAATFGGGIRNEGTATVTASGFEFNGASHGGGIDNDRLATVTNCTLDNNSATFGGGIGNGGTATVTNCTLAYDSGSDSGGGLFNFAGTVTVTGCNFDHDSAVFGGGLFTHAGTALATVTDCTFAGDAAGSNGGGIYNDETVNITNCTLTENSAADFAAGINNFGAATLTNCTVADNSATNAGGGILSTTGAITVNNTIVAANQAVAAPDFSGALNPSSSFNLIGDGTGLSGVSTGVQGNQVGTTASPINPLLGPLQDNGGLTRTVALLPGSPAIDSGSNALALDAGGNMLTTDQRGVARITNGTVDIGAFESRPFTIAITSGNEQSSTVGTAFVNPLAATVTSPYGDPVQGGVVSFTAPGSGAGATVSGGSGTIAIATIDPAGQAAVAVAANTVAGNYAVMASARGATFPAGFSLTNTPRAAASMTATFGTSQSTTVGYAFKTPLQVLVADAYGNAVPGAIVTFLTPSSGAGGSFRGGAVVTSNALGIAAPTFSANTKAGSYVVSAFVSGVAAATSFSLTNTPDVASTLLITAPPAVTRGAPFSFTVTALDRYSNIATSYSGTVSFSSSDRKASLPANYTFIASDNGVHTFQATFNTVDSQTLTVSDTVTLSLTSTVTLSVSGKSGTPVSIANPSTSSVAPAAELGTFRAHARPRRGRQVVPSRHHAIKAPGHGDADRLSPTSVRRMWQRHWRD